MKQWTMLGAAAVIGLAASGTAFAEHGRYGDYDRYDRYERYDDRYGYDRYPAEHGARYDWGRVLRVDPIVSRDVQPIRHRECWSQPVVYREPVRYRYDGHRDRTPALLGAIVGGVIGNQFGSGHGRDAATVAGAALGYSAVRDSQRRYGGGYYKGGRQVRVYEQRCAPRTSYVRDERVHGFEVT